GVRRRRAAAGRAPALYRFDENVRCSLVLGPIGASGIGFLINHSVSLFRFDEMLAYILMVSGLLRRRPWPDCPRRAVGRGDRGRPDRRTDARPAARGTAVA